MAGSRWRRGLRSRRSTARVRSGRPTTRSTRRWRGTQHRAVRFAQQREAAQHLRRTNALEGFDVAVAQQVECSARAGGVDDSTDRSEFVGARLQRRAQRGRAARVAAAGVYASIGEGSRCAPADESDARGAIAQQVLGDRGAQTTTAADDHVGSGVGGRAVFAASMGSSCCSNQLPSRRATIAWWPSGWRSHSSTSSVSEDSVSSVASISALRQRSSGCSSARLASAPRDSDANASGAGLPAIATPRSRGSAPRARSRTRVTIGRSSVWIVSRSPAGSGELSVSSRRS